MSSGQEERAEKGDPGREITCEYSTPDWFTSSHTITAMPWIHSMWSHSTTHDKLIFFRVGSYRMRTALGPKDNLSELHVITNALQMI